MSCSLKIRTHPQSPRSLGRGSRRPFNPLPPPPHRRSSSVFLERELTLDGAIVSAVFHDSMDVGVVGTTAGTLWHVSWAEGTGTRLISGHRSKVRAFPPWTEAGRWATRALLCSSFPACSQARTSSAAGSWKWSRQSPDEDSLELCLRLHTGLSCVPARAFGLLCPYLVLFFS